MKFNQNTCSSLIIAASVFLAGCPVPTDTTYMPEMPPEPVAVKSIAQTTPVTDAATNGAGEGSDAAGEGQATSPSPTPPPAHIKTVAGSEEESDYDGEGADVGFKQPGHIALGGDALFIVDTGNHQIRRFSLDTYEVTTVAGSESGSAEGSKVDAKFKSPSGIAVGDNVIYVADTRNHVIRRIDLTKDESDAQYVTTLAGDGTAGYLDGDTLDAQFNEPRGLALDQDINALFVADSLNHNIRRISLSTMTVTTVAGESPASDAVDVSIEPDFQDDVASAARFHTPHDVAVSRAGDLLYVADTGNQRVRTIDLASLAVTTLAGSGAAGLLDGKGKDAQFREPVAISVDRDGNVWVADRENHRIRKVTPRGFVSSEVGTGAAGDTDGIVAEAMINRPSGVYANQKVYITTDTMLRLVQFP